MKKAWLWTAWSPPHFPRNIWLFPFGGTASRFMFSPAQRPVWSPDGKRIAYETLDTAIYEKPTSGKEDETLLLKAGHLPPDGRVPCDWSRDGRFLIYAELGKQTGFDLVEASGGRQPAARCTAEREFQRILWSAFAGRPLDRLFVGRFRAQRSLCAVAAGKRPRDRSKMAGFLYWRRLAEMEAG